MTVKHGRRSILRARLRRGSLGILATLIVLFASVMSASAADITSAGPLTTVTTTPDLNCAVNHVGDDSGEFFGGTACGTFVTDGTTLYGPASVPAGVSPTVAWTPVSQTGPTGTGTQSDPYTVVTTVTGGPFTVVQTDTYVLGEESVRTDVKVTSSTAVNAIVYRAGDCFLQDSDSGLGELGAGQAPTCRAESTSTNPNRIEQWYPLTSGSNYMVDGYYAVWGVIGSMTAFPDTVLADQGGSPYDNGAGLSWSVPLTAGGSTTLSSLMVFSPVGIQPLTVAETVTPGTVIAGNQVTYTITVTNPSLTAVPLSSITDTLPSGFAYVNGTTTGVSTSNPTVSGNMLTWSGAYSVPAQTGSTPGTVTLSFTATAGQTAGTYSSSATAVGSGGATIIGATDVAPVVVTAPLAQAPLTVTSTAGVSGVGLALSTSGGSGSGAVTYSVTDGTASGCAVSVTAPYTLTSTTPGTCSVTATKAGDGTYGSVSSAATTATLDRLTTYVGIPHGGSTLQGSVWVDAGATSDVGVASVTFEVSGGPGNLTNHVVGTGTHTRWGYIGGFDTTGVPNGTYTVQSVVKNTLGASVTSAPITVTVDNKPLTAVMLIPSSGASMSNGSILDAMAIGLTPVNSVTYTITGGTLTDHVVGHGAVTIYGWLALMDTSGVPSGSYNLVATATTTGGETATSTSVTINIGTTG